MCMQLLAPEEIDPVAAGLSGDLRLADARAALEVQFLAQKRDILQGKRQERRVALMGRVRDREALEIDAGQAKARKRAAAEERAAYRSAPAPA